jgi:predicted small integral membrane protein
MGWMAWTRHTAVFFGCIFATLILMGLWEARSPSVPRRGFLPMQTTRGDRLFIGLLATAFINMAWLALTTITPWVALGISAVVMLAIGLWG